MQKVTLSQAEVLFHCEVHSLSFETSHIGLFPIAKQFVEWSPLYKNKTPAWIAGVLSASVFDAYALYE